MENQSISESYDKIKHEIEINDGGQRFYKKHLLNSINESLGKRDLEAIYYLHQYFDYNLNFIDRSSAKPSHSVKVHQPELNLASLQLRLGHIDTALLSVLETIRIS